MKKILFLPAAIVVAGALYAAAHFGFSDNQTANTHQPLVAGNHTSVQAPKPQAAQTSPTNEGNAPSSNTADNNSPSQVDLGYHLYMGPPVANGIATLTSSNPGNSSSSSNSGSSTPAPTPTPQPVAAPTVTITSPAEAATVSGMVNLSASVTSTEAVAGVQFKVDGANVGPEVTAAPYTTVWDSTKATSGPHSLSATVRTITNVTADAPSIGINVMNVVPTPTPTPTPQPAANLITNGSAEDSLNGLPSGWAQDGYGTNTSAYNYLNTGHTGSHSLQVNTTAYTDGDAKWGFTAVPVTAGQSYQFSDFYQSDSDLQVDTAFTISGQTGLSFFYLGAAPASAAWNQFTGQFTAPAGATSIIVYHILNKIGTLTTDDYSLSNYTPTGFNRPIVTINFDDGWSNQYQNAFPLLQSYGLNATFFIISGELADQPDYMSTAQILELQAAGNEIGSHSITHPDLTTLTHDQIVSEMTDSKTTLQNAIGVAVTNFAYPFGAFNADTIAVGLNLYTSQRSVISGQNSKDTLNLTQLKIQEVDSNITPAQVQAWVDQAIAQKTWLILVFHETATTPIAPDDDLYTTQPADLNTELAYIKNSGVTVETMKQAVAEVTAQ